MSSAARAGATFSKLWMSYGHPCSTHRLTVAGADLDVADVEHACPDLFQSIEHRTHRLRSARNTARSSALNSAGCSQAAKWPPRSTSLK